MYPKPAFLAKFLLFEGGPQERKKSAHVDIYSRLIVSKGDKIAVNQLREKTCKYILRTTLHVNASSCFVKFICWI